MEVKWKTAHTKHSNKNTLSDLKETNGANTENLCSSSEIFLLSPGELCLHATDLVYVQCKLLVLMQECVAFTEQNNSPSRELLVSLEFGANKVFTLCSPIPPYLTLIMVFTTTNHSSIVPEFPQGRRIKH